MSWEIYMSLRLIGIIYISMEAQIDDLQFSVPLWSLERPPEAGGEKEEEVI